MRQLVRGCAGGVKLPQACMSHIWPTESSSRREKRLGRTPGATRSSTNAAAACIDWTSGRRAALSPRSRAPHRTRLPSKWMPRSWPGGIRAVANESSLWHAIAQFFSQQTNHRGQVTTLMQAGHDPGERHAHAEARDVAARAARARRTGPIVQVLYMQGGRRGRGTSLGPSGRGRAAAIRRSARSWR
jgi:hypothetical protein